MRLSAVVGVMLLVNTAGCQSFADGDAGVGVSPDETPQGIVLARLLSLVRSGAIFSASTYSEAKLKESFGAKIAEMTYKVDVTGAVLQEFGSFASSASGTWISPKYSTVGIGFVTDRNGHKQGQASIDITEPGSGFSFNLLERHVGQNLVEYSPTIVDGPLFKMPRTNPYGNRFFTCRIKAAHHVFIVEVSTHYDGSIRRLNIASEEADKP